MTYRLPPPTAPQPPRYTVAQLIADRSLLDITRYVQRDPAHPFPIGAGGGGNVYRAFYRWRDRDSGLLRSLNVVVKLIAGTTTEQLTIERRLNREIATWRGLDHPNVAELLGIASVNSNLPPGLVSRWVQRHDFLAYIGRHPELKRGKAQEIACGLEYLHANNVVHGDMKVNNILVSEHGVAQITDFGIARILGVRGYTTTVASRNVRYTAPELLPIDTETDIEDARPTKRSDIFSLGILFLQLFHGPDDNEQRGMPYNHVRYNPTSYDWALLVRIHNEERPIRGNYNYIRDQHWRIMQRCWAHNPYDRPVIAEVRNHL